MVRTGPLLGLMLVRLQPTMSFKSLRTDGETSMVHDLMCQRYERCTLAHMLDDT